MVWIVQDAEGEVVGVYDSRDAALLAHEERLGIAGDDWLLSGPWLIRRVPEDTFASTRKGSGE